MSFSKIILAGAAALALTACGGKDKASDAPKSEASAKAAKVSAASPLESEFRLKDAEPVDIDAFFALLPADARPDYESAKFDEKLGATVVTNLRLADANDGESVLIERAEFFGLDMGAIERIDAATTADNNAPYEVVFQKVRLLNISAEGFDTESGSLTIAGAEFDKLGIRPGIDIGEDNEAARFFNGVSLAGLYYKDIVFSMAEEDKMAVAFKAPDLRFVGMAGGKLDAIIVNDLEYDVTQSDETIAAIGDVFGPQGAMLMNSPLRGMIAPKSQRTKVGALEWRDIDLSGWLEWGLKGEDPPASERDLIDLGTMKATDMESFIDGRRAALVEEATITAAEFTWLIPSSIRADTKGAIYDFTAYAPESNEDALGVMKEFGLDEVKGDGYAEWKWNPDKGGANLNYVANTDGVADFSMSFDLSELKLKEMEKAMDAGEENAFAALGAFKGFSMKLDDEKALDAIFALSALQMGGSGEDLRQSAPALIRLSGAQAAQFNPRVSSYVNAFADFIAKGGSIEISASPEEPVAFSSLRATGVPTNELPDVLNLTVTHSE